MQAVWGWQMQGACECRRQGQPGVQSRQCWQQQARYVSVCGSGCSGLLHGSSAAAAPLPDSRIPGCAALLQQKDLQDSVALRASKRDRVQAVLLAERAAVEPFPRDPARSREILGARCPLCSWSASHGVLLLHAGLNTTDRRAPYLLRDIACRLARSEERAGLSCGLEAGQHSCLLSDASAPKAPGGAGSGQDNGPTTGSCHTLTSLVRPSKALPLKAATGLPATATRERMCRAALLEVQAWRLLFAV